MLHKLSREEVIDYTHFWEGDDVPENASFGCRPILYTIRFLAHLSKCGHWGEMQSNRGALFLLGCFLYEKNRRIVSGKRQAAIRRMSQKERV